ncbi:MAG: hypothetical protein ACREFQ_01040, partial [Stellaceae bacterium]
IQAGRVSVIGLDKVKARLGNDWQRLSARVDVIVRNTIKKHLLPGDVFTGFGEANYVIVFAGLDPGQARIKCLLVADEIVKSLLGEDAGDLISIATAVAGFTGSSSIDAIMSPDCPLDAYVPALRPPVAAAPPSQAVELVDADAVPLDAREPARAVYRPMWDTQNAVISTFTAMIEDGGLRTAHDAAHELDWIAERDLLLQERVLEELESLLASRSRLLIGLSVSFETLAASARRREYLVRLQKQLSPRAAPLLVIEIAAVPEGVLQPRLIELVAPLRRYCRGVLACARLETADLASFRQTGLSAVGCDVAESGGSEAALHALMSRFTRAAEKAQLPAYVRGLSTASLAAAAVGSGFRYIEGSAIGEPVTHPSGILRFNLEDMYRALLQPEPRAG